MKEKPYLSFEMIKRMEDMSFFTYAQIFDDLLIVAQVDLIPGKSLESIYI